jgi:hypothetical protein
MGERGSWVQITYGYWGVYDLDVTFLDKDLSGFDTQPLDLFLWYGGALNELFYLTLESENTRDESLDTCAPVEVTGHVDCVFVPALATHYVDDQMMVSAIPLYSHIRN